MARPLLCLVAIVKDEASNIRATLESARPFVDRWCVLDTGSTDGTQAIVRSVMDGIPGTLYEEPFVDFATSRNRALELAGSASVFTLSLSGDETLHRGSSLCEFLEARRDGTEGAFGVEIETGHAVWTYPRILRTDARWRYVGAVHEVPVGPDGETTGSCIRGVRVVHRESDPQRKSRRIREFDLPVLTEVVSDESKTLDERAQAIFFLADAHALVANEMNREPGNAWLTHKMMAMALYWRYTEIASVSTNRNYDPLKVQFAALRYLNLAESINLYDHEELLSRLEPLARLAPTIPEVRYMIAAHAAQLDPRRGAYLAEEAARVAREQRDKPIHLPTDSRVEWLSLRLAAECAKVQRNDKRARELAERGIKAGGPAEEFAGYMK